MYKICFYVPESHVEGVKKALFDVGAGKQGEYECCCWQTKGVGQFRPLPGSDPFIGEVRVLTKVDEYKVEMLCDSRFLKKAVKALRQAHPYEEPAFDVIEILQV